MPRGLYGVVAGAGLWIDEVQAMVNGAVRVTMRVEIAIRTPAIADDRRAWFDPFTYKSRQRVGGSVRYGNKKCSAGPSFDTAKHPMTLNRVPSIVFSPTDLALVNFDDLIRTADILRAALQELEHGFPSERAPVSDRMVTQVKFVFDLVGRVAAQDVVRNRNNFQECAVTQPEPGAVPNGHRPTTPDPSNTPSTSPPKSVITSGVCVPRLISFADVTLHPTRDETHVLQEFNRQFVASKK